MAHASDRDWLVGRSFAIDGARVERFASVVGAIGAEHDGGSRVPAAFSFVALAPSLVELVSRALPTASAVVHRSHEIVLSRPLEVGDAVVPRVALDRMRSTPLGAVVAVVGQLSVADQVVNRQAMTFLVPGIEVADVDDDASLRLGSASAPSARQADAVVQRTISRADVAAYADVSGDWQPIHLHDEVAQDFGLPRAVVHGIFLLAIAEAVVHSAAGEGHLGRIGTTFSRPVPVDSDVAVAVWTDATADGVHARFQASTAQSRAAVLKAGFADILR